MWGWRIRNQRIFFSLEHRMKVFSFCLGTFYLFTFKLLQNTHSLSWERLSSIRCPKKMYLCPITRFLGHWLICDTLCCTWHEYKPWTMIDHFLNIIGIIAITAKLFLPGIIKCPCKMLYGTKIRFLGHLILESPSLRYMNRKWKLFPELFQEKKTINIPETQIDAKSI